MCKLKESIDARSSTFFNWGRGFAASFVRRASAFSEKAGAPLILPSVRKPEETLYVYMQDCEFDENDEVAEYDAKWRVSLGPDQPFAPPPPTWREHLRRHGHPLETHDEIERNHKAGAVLSSHQDALQTRQRPTLYPYLSPRNEIRVRLGTNTACQTRPQCRHAKSRGDVAGSARARAHRAADGPPARRDRRIVDRYRLA